MEASSIISETPKEESIGGKERRRSRRHDCEGFAEAWVKNPESLFRGEIRDISLTGCFIRTKALLKLTRFAAVDLRFTLRNSQYHASARAMDVRPGKGVGLEFIFPDMQAPQWLQHMLDMLSDAAAQPSKKT